ncbi:hypothetical protein ABK040_013731 [Willaertia magna]
MKQFEFTFFKGEKVQYTDPFYSFISWNFEKSTTEQGINKITVTPSIKDKPHNENTVVYEQIDFYPEIIIEPYVLDQANYCYEPHTFKDKYQLVRGEDPIVLTFVHTAEHFSEKDYIREFAVFRIIHKEEPSVKLYYRQ